MFRIFICIIITMISIWIISLLIDLMNLSNTLAFGCGILGILMTMYFTLWSVYKLLIKK